MNLLLDTSVIIASLDGDEFAHAACDRLLAQGGHKVYSHALAETFSILSGGRQARRLRPALVAQLIEDSVLPFVQLVHLTGKETMAVIANCEPVARAAARSMTCCIWPLPARPVCRPW